MGSFLLIIIAVGAMYWMHGRGGGCCGGGHSHGHGHNHNHNHNHGRDSNHNSYGERQSSSCHLQPKQMSGQILHKDPVCGSNVAEDAAIKKIINRWHVMWMKQSIKQLLKK